MARIIRLSKTQTEKMPTRKIRSFADLDVLRGRINHVLTLFSGGLDSSYVLKELAQRQLRVTALSVNVGEGSDIQDLQGIVDFFGAELTIIDAREMFASEAVAPAICAQARYLGIYLLFPTARYIAPKGRVLIDHLAGTKAI